MLTIFTCPKPFLDPHIVRIQRNAIASWLALDPRPQVLLIGDEPGVAAAAAEFGVRHICDVERSAAGTPLVSSVFAAAERTAGEQLSADGSSLSVRNQKQAAPSVSASPSQPAMSSKQRTTRSRPSLTPNSSPLAPSSLLAYVNCDIVLGQDFMDTVQVVSRMGRCLMVGERTDFDVRAGVQGQRHDAQPEANIRDDLDWVRNDARARGVRKGPAALDYFVFSRGLWPHVPPFLIGRFAWDNWLLWAARENGARLIDATESVLAVHQNHGYFADGLGTEEQARLTSETSRNRALAEGAYCDIGDCRYAFKWGRVVPFRDPAHVWRRVDELRDRKPAVWRALRFWRLRYAVCRAFPGL